MRRHLTQKWTRSKLHEFPGLTVLSLVVLGLVLGTGCAPQTRAASSEPQAAWAMGLHVAQPLFHTPQIFMAKSMPPQFTVTLARDMPTAGWTFQVDELDVQAPRGRIRAKVTALAPKDLAAQVVTRTYLRLELGAIRAARYDLEIWYRRGTSEPHKRVQTWVLDASPR